MDGYTSYPTYRSILWPGLVFGMPRKLAITLATATLAVAMGLGQIWFVPFAIVLAVLFNIMSREDMYFFEIYMAVIKLPDIAD